VGKIAPALVFGNAVILKPAPPASRTALAILETLESCGIPQGVVNIVMGDATTARALCRERRVAAVSVTGAMATGRAVAAHCAEGMKPLQAELGGNNAAIVLHDADLADVVPGLVRAAFGFAGQRCVVSSSRSPLPRALQRWRLTPPPRSRTVRRTIRRPRSGR
jgi:aldehyde dehydrogenase (NAD+)